MAIENENANNIITVFQEIGANEYLVELTEDPCTGNDRKRI